jgi:hypothetical protein
MSNRMFVKTAGVVVVAAVAMAGAGTGVAGATPSGAPSNGCPNGYSLLAVADLAPKGYRVPGQVDDPQSGIRSFGSIGNGDGWVCAQEVGSRTTSWGDQLYQFWDNSLPA